MTFYYEAPRPPSAASAPTIWPVFNQPTCSILEPFDPTEYYIEECPQTAATPAPCTHTYTYIKPLCAALERRVQMPPGMPGHIEPEEMPEFLAIASALPHMHTFAISIDLQDAITNTTICSMSRDNGGLIYGVRRRSLEPRTGAGCLAHPATRTLARSR